MLIFKYSLGKNYIAMSLAQVIISPIIGLLMDVVAKASPSGEPNYLVPFIGNDIFILLCVFFVCKISLDLELPKPAGLKSLFHLVTNWDISMFLFMTLILGNMWGFVETFLFVYLKEDMGAPMYLMGLTITVGAAASIPVFFVVDKLVEKVGKINVFIIALFMYSVRYIGYSFINNPWMAFPFELLELFTNNIMRVAALRYIGEISPEGNLIINLLIY